jgi:hypothetical protein
MFVDLTRDGAEQVVCDRSVVAYQQLCAPFSATPMSALAGSLGAGVVEREQAFPLTAARGKLARVYVTGTTSTSVGRGEGLTASNVGWDALYDRHVVGHVVSFRAVTDGGDPRMPRCRSI